MTDNYAAASNDPRVEEKAGHRSDLKNLRNLCNLRFNLGIKSGGDYRARFSSDETKNLNRMTAQSSLTFLIHSQ